MRRRRQPAALAVMLLLAGAGGVATGCSSGGSARSADTAHPATGGLPDRGTAATVAVDPSGPGRRVPAGFLGLSIEFPAVRGYTGPDPARVNPVLAALIRNLSPGQPPVLRIGGDSSDASYAPAARVRPPGYDAYRLTPGWMATTAALAHDTGARMILGLNLVADDPALAAAEARDYVSAIGRGAIDAVEIGNEPNIYGKIRTLRTSTGAPFRSRPRDYGYMRFRREFQAIAAAVAPLPLAGPGLAIGPTPAPGSWVQTMPDLLRRDPRLGILTVHRYPLRNCFVPPRSPQYPSVAHLLSDYATTTLAAGLKRWITIAHSQGRRLRVDEFNSVACHGKRGVSDTFAAALWMPDALFALAQAGIDGVNVHTLPGTAYQLFRFSHRGGRWRAAVEPVYYGLALFAQAAPAGSRLVALGGRHWPSDVSVWATRTPDRRLRVLLINKGLRRARALAIRLPPGTGRTAVLERLTAPSVNSQSGISLGGRSYGAETSTGSLGPPRTERVARRGGAYTVAVPPASAALVTFGG